MKSLLIYSIFFLLFFSSFTEVDVNHNTSVLENSAINGMYPVITERSVKTFNGDSIILVKANGLPAIIARNNQNVNSLLEFAGVPMKKFAKYNDIDEMFADELIVGAVYYLKPKSSKAEIEYHYVKPGETIWDISQMYAVKLNSLLSKNRMTENENLAPGRKLFLRSKRSSKVQIEIREVTEDSKKNAKDAWFDLRKEFGLLLPNEKPTVKPEVTVAKPAIDLNNPIYIVQEGDDIFSIAKMYNLTVLDLRDWNNLGTNYQVKAGDQIRVKEPQGVQLQQVENRIAIKESAIILPDSISSASQQIAQPNANNPVAFMDPALGNQQVAQPVATQPAGNTYDNQPVAQNYATPVSGPIDYSQVNVKTIHHTVKRGETIYKLARTYGVEPEEILNWNDLKKGAWLYVGDNIIIKMTNDIPGSPKVHTVKEGETLFSLARKYKVSVDDLKTWNNLPGDQILAGNDMIVSAIGYVASQPQLTQPQPTQGEFQNPATQPNYNVPAVPSDPQNQGALPLQNNNPDQNTAVNPATSTVPNYNQPAQPNYNQPAGTAPNYNQPATEPGGSVSVQDENSVYHTVQDGDDIYKLSAKYKATISDLRNWNNLPFGSELKVGDKIIVGKKGEGDFQ
ncbi:LysM peptidoglycan-binding domain-containing protein [Flexithrix dorotheae]|uniref:LysM peptidoglycan-binding domain-containing protein n=1 Tax=Flexithrix dorotheae TaxID=70993 RepID=UPI00037C51C7|nr:LysM peptidoglycan-binding domain-containing protein [Flexithrix dorotheae]